MANTIPAGLQLTETLNYALIAMRRRLTAIGAFCLSWSDVKLQGNGKAQVPYYPLATSDSEDREAGDDYESLVSNTVTEVREIPISYEKVQGLAFTAEEIARQPGFNPEIHGTLKGDKLAFDVVQHILSVVTAANYPADPYISTAGNFDAYDVYDLQTDCDEANWPDMGRSLLLKPSYYNGVIKTQATQDFGNSNDPAVFRKGMVQELAGFDVMKVNAIPHNSEYLQGFACHKSAILVGFSPVPPDEAQMKNIYAYEIVKDEYSGIVLEYLEYGIPGKKKTVQAISCNYGFAKGEGAAIIPIRSQALGS